ncbi:MAG: hypothetical protein E4H05_11010, partial [Acidimicrobiales bacterium]
MFANHRSGTPGTSPRPNWFRSAACPNDSTPSRRRPRTSCVGRVIAAAVHVSSSVRTVSRWSTLPVACWRGSTPASTWCLAPPLVPQVADPRLAYRWIDRQVDVDEIVTTLLDQPRYALDTEFHRERTYYPKLALMQVAWRSDDGQQVALIDPLAVDVGPFDTLFASESLCVIHAAQQDLDVLTHAVGSVPTRMFDTQLAAGFLGYGTPSLVSLLQGEIGVTPAKGDRLTDWLRRPLTDSQCQYAAVDVEYLLEVHERLVAQLADVDRLGWADDACEELRTRPTSGSAPDDAWLRLKDARSLRPGART